MRHNFYANNRNPKGAIRPYSGVKTGSGNRYNRSDRADPPKISVGEKILDSKIRSVLSAYNGDQEARSAIVGDLETFQLNISIARLYQDKRSEKDLYIKLHNYLNNLLNERK